MSWPTTEASDILGTPGAKTWGSDIFDRQEIAGQSRWTWGDATVKDMTTTLITQFISLHRMPVWCEATAVISVTFLAWRDAAVSGNCSFRIRANEDGVWTNGTTNTTALTNAWAPYTVVLTVPASPSWAGELVQVDLQAQRPANGYSDSDFKVSLYGIFANVSVNPL